MAHSKAREVGIAVDVGPTLAALDFADDGDGLSCFGWANVCELRPWVRERGRMALLRLFKCQHCRSYYPGMRQLGPVVAATKLCGTWQRDQARQFWGGTSHRESLARSLEVMKHSIATRTKGAGQLPARDGEAVTEAGAPTGCTDGTADCITYPHADVTSFVAHDYVWLYAASPLRWRTASDTGATLAAIAAGPLLIDYGAQLLVVQPSVLVGESSGLSVLSQYNLHVLFIGLWDIGDATLALALILLLFVILAFVYRSALDVRFEVLALLLTYLVLIAAGTMLSITLSPRMAKLRHKAETTKYDHSFPTATRGRGKPAIGVMT